MEYVELFLAVAFTGLVVALPLFLLFALVADAVGWYDSNGVYTGPFSKSRRR